MSFIQGNTLNFETDDKITSVALPQLRSSADVDMSKPLPTSLQSDFIPEDILFALTQPPSSKDKLGPLTRGRNLNTTSGATRPPPANVWGSKRRDRFKHLIDNTPCACGAGKDISFLYDVPQSMTHAQKPDTIDKSAIRKEETTGKPLHLPDTLIPDEYRIVKNKGVVGIQFHEDKYSTNPKDHEKHLVVFPSMKPASRREVIQLKEALNNMLDKAGVNDLDTDRGTGPTQMHNLLDLIKKEQNIYNVVFHELIRQTSIECVERGELLADLRNKYSDLLNRIPQQIMGLHEEVMAQRALDRRLTDELMRFKGTIGVLTSELSEVKEHDRKVTKEAQKAQEDLRNALVDSQKNASLLAEYHDLYELQRRRLERQVFMLSEEREIWSTAAYSLALKVTEEYRLNTAKRLQLSEKGWVKMATHFTVLLSDRDTDLLTKIQGFVENWRDLIEDFNIALKQREQEIRISLRGVRQGIESWMRSFHDRYIKRKGKLEDADGAVYKKPDEEFTRSLMTAMKDWDEAILKECEVFGGDNLLNSQEELSHIRREMDGWTDNALKVFSRHRGADNKTHPDQVNMLALNEGVDELLTQFHHRITGENGVAGLVIHLQSALETWDTRLIGCLQGTVVLQEADWGSFYQTLEEWLQLLDNAVEYVGTTQKDDDRQDGRPHTSIDIHDVVRKTQKWATTASNSVDSEDAKLVEQVSSLHSEMVRWMVQVLLRLAPDMEGNSKEAGEMALLGSASIPQLTEVAKTLFDSIETFSNYVYLCCNGIVLENTQKRQDNMEENADHEMKDLKRLRSECDDWTHTARMLMSQLTGMPIEQLFPARASTTLSKRPPSPEEPVDRVAFVDQEKLLRGISEETPQQEAQPEEPQEPEPAPEESEQQLEEVLDEMEEGLDDEPAVKSDEMQEESEEKSGEDEEGASAETPKPETPAEKKDEGERIEVLGFDSNTHRQNMNPADAQVLGQVPVQPGVEGSPDTKKAYEALSAVQTLQTQLISAEERAQEAEIRASQAESEIVELQEKLRAVEKQMEENQKTLDRNTSSATMQSTANATPAAVAATGTPTDSPRTDGEKDKTGRKSGRSSSKGSKKK